VRHDGAGVLACHTPWLKSSLLKMEANFGQYSEWIVRHSKICYVWWHLHRKRRQSFTTLCDSPRMTAHHSEIPCYRYWLTACATYNRHGPCRMASKHAPVCCPYCDHIATELMKKHNMSSFFEDFRQKISRTRFPVHTAGWRPYNPAVLPGRAEQA